MLYDLLDRPIAYHRVLAEIAGSVSGGVFLSQAIYWSKRATLPDGWFYKTSDQWFEETYLTRREQETVRKRLAAINVLQEEKRGVPAKLHYRVNESELERHVLQRYDTQGHTGRQGAVQTSLAENAKLDWRKAPNKDGGKRQTNTETTAETTSETTQDISYDQEFAEFWSTYPKRPNNSKASAKKKYILARKRGVPHVIIMAGVRDYATARNKAVDDGDSPTYTQMAETWLNKECWENDYNPPADVKKEPVATDGELFDLAAEYPGHIGSYGVAQKLLADELSKGATIEALCEAARKYKLFCKGPPYEDRKIAPAMLEQWLKFKWREMDGYEFCTVGPDRIKTVRPKKANV
jgi:hypothetical protein